MNSIWRAGELQACPPRIVFFSSSVKAGFPSPAESYTEQPLNLHELAVVNPAATYIVQASGDSMTGAGIFPGDYLVVDRSLIPNNGDIVIAEISGNLTVKTLGFELGRPILIPSNPSYPVIRPNDGEELAIWGVVRFVGRNLK